MRSRPLTNDRDSVASTHEPGVAQVGRGPQHHRVADRITTDSPAGAGVVGSIVVGGAVGATVVGGAPVPDVGWGPLPGCGGGDHRGRYSRRWRRGVGGEGVAGGLAALFDRLGDLVLAELGGRQADAGEHETATTRGADAGDQPPRGRVARRLQAPPPAAERAAAGSASRRSGTTTSVMTTVSGHGADELRQRERRCPATSPDDLVDRPVVQVQPVAASADPQQQRVAEQRPVHARRWVTAAMTTSVATPVTKKPPRNSHGSARPSAVTTCRYQHSTPSPARPSDGEHVEQRGPCRRSGPRITATGRHTIANAAPEQQPAGPA